MKIALVSVGSRGDLQPYLALGRRLKKNGHSVRIGALATFADDVRAEGIDFASLGEFPERFRARRGGSRSGAFAGVVGRALFWTILPRLLSPVEDRFIAACEGMDAVLFTRLALPVPHIAEALKVPCIAAFPVPHTPTAAFENPLYVRPGVRSAGSVRTRLSYVCESTLTHRLSYSVIARLRRRLGLRSIPPDQAAAHQSRLLAGTLYGYSEHVLPRPTDWPERVEVTGHWFCDARDDWTPPPELQEFLSAGKKPVCIGFGSMNPAHPARTARTVRDALERIDARAVVLGGWGATDSRRILAMPDVPHDWLLPRTAAVVHHGGIGTTAAAIRAGIPSVIVPHAFDQRFWGRRMHDLHCGPAPIEERNLSAARLAGALSQALDDDALRSAVTRLGSLVRAEDGARRAVSLIEQWTRTA